MKIMMKIMMNNTTCILAQLVGICGGCVGSHGSSSSSSRDGVPAAADATLVLEGRQFRDFVVGPDGIIDKAAFTAIWPRLRVLARCSPQDKYTIVKGQSAPPSTYTSNSNACTIIHFHCSWPVSHSCSPHKQHARLLFTKVATDLDC